jgi:L-alanine-DL-glutamate epimerase-like enolase superfamily enzyme
MYFVYRADREAMCEGAARAVDAGYRCIYAKVGIEPAEDIAVVSALREAIGQRAQLRVDANESWSPGMAVRMIRELAHYRLEFVEQPVLADDVEGMAALRRRVSTPICADQAARTPAAVLDVVRHQAADVVSVCLGDAGGILAAMRSASIAEAAGIPVFIHSNIELGIATAAHVHLAAAIPNCHYASQTELQFLDGDVLADEDMRLDGGSIDVPAAPGPGRRRRRGAGAGVPRPVQTLGVPAAARASLIRVAPAGVLTAALRPGMPPPLAP